MKTRELTADEVNIALSEKDISAVPADPDAVFPADKTAEQALITALRIRGRAMNVFVCGPSAPERTAAIIKAASAVSEAGGRLVLAEDGGNPAVPKIIKTETADEAEIGKLLKSEKKAGRKAVELTTGTEAAAGNAAMPVVIENNPVSSRLFGRTASDITLVKPGSVVQSSGGILVLNAEDLLEEEDSWKRLKRVIRAGSTVLGDGDDEDAGSSQSGDDNSQPQLILPEIELDLKVVILGAEHHFDHFYNHDEDFRELFQFFAEFDSVVDMNEENLADSVNWLRNYCRGNLGIKLGDSGAFEAVKYSIASAENNTKLSALNSELEFLLTEAAINPAALSAGEITADAVKSTVQNQADRYSLLERRILEDIETGEINLQVDGSEIGKVNGLAVIDKGSWSFGSPGLISARIAPGESGLVNIEHEAGLSGEIHDKWVLILEGFLRSRFAQDFPISIFASICFEQSYSEIDGDSASSSELYALLSAIAGVPVRQDIAVTGSLSQTGEIQAVGGLREKIEGFYKVCRTIGFTGRQGVIVPERNIKNIILPDEIISDIRSGRFHIHTVSTVDDSMELLTGMEAGKRNSRGVFPHGSLNYLIEKNLKRLASQGKNMRI